MCCPKPGENLCAIGARFGLTNKSGLLKEESETELMALFSVLPNSDQEEDFAVQKEFFILVAAIDESEAGAKTEPNQKQGRELCCLPVTSSH